MKEKALLIVLLLLAGCSSEQTTATNDEPSGGRKVLRAVGAFLGGLGKAHSHDQSVRCKSEKVGNTVYTTCE